MGKALLVEAEVVTKNTCRYEIECVFSLERSKEILRGEELYPAEVAEVIIAFHINTGANATFWMKGNNLGTLSEESN